MRPISTRKVNSRVSPSTGGCFAHSARLDVSCELLSCYAIGTTEEF